MFDISLEHPEYILRKGTWKVYRDLYVGGDQLKGTAHDYLTRRHKEPNEIYAERLSHVFYENYIGSIIDWYAATLFRREAVITTDGANEAGKRFFSSLTEDCDLRGTSITDFLRRRFVDALVCGSSYMLIDFPNVGKRPGNRAEEEALGASRAYLVDYLPENIINWSYDEHGNYEWVVIRTSRMQKERIEDTNWVTETRWTYYDKENYRVYRKAEPGSTQGAPELVGEGLHGLANQHRVPLVELRLSEGLWLMNKAGLLQLEHFNKSNALAWALTMGLFAMPVIYSERDWQQAVGESYYIQLGPQDRFGWTEPDGKVYQIAADNLTRLQNEIYRVCYLLTQAGGTGAAPQSGLSKQRDFAITHEVLRAYGDAVKDVMKRTLRWIEAAREDGLVIDISGLDEFDIGDLGAEITDAQSLFGLGIESPTLKRQIFTKLALKYLCDVRQEVKDQIAREIEGTAV